jgi:hypothetical protein
MRWLAGPRPCRSIATAALCSLPSSGSSGCAGTTSSMPPTQATSAANAGEEADVQLYERKSERQAQARRTAQDASRSVTPPQT